MNYALLTILFVLLSPGIIFTLPPVSNKIIRTGETSITSVFIHSILFISIIYLIDSSVWKNEFFGNTKGSVSRSNVSISYR